MDAVALTKQEIFNIGIQAAQLVLEANKKKAEENPISLEEVCELTGYLPTTIYSFTKRKAIPCHRAPGGRKLIFYRSEIVEWLSKRQEVNQ